MSEEGDRCGGVGLVGGVTTDLMDRDGRDRGRRSIALLLTAELRPIFLEQDSRIISSEKRKIELTGAGIRTEKLGGRFGSLE